MNKNLPNCFDNFINPIDIIVDYESYVQRTVVLTFDRVKMKPSHDMLLYRNHYQYVQEDNPQHDKVLENFHQNDIHCYENFLNLFLNFQVHVQLQ